MHATTAQPAGSRDDPAPPQRGAIDAIGAVVLLADDDAATRSQKLARIVLDEMYQFVGLLDAEGRTLEINRAALNGAGVQLDQIRGQPFWEARWFQVSRETVQQTRDQVRRARAGEFIRCDLEVYGQSEGEHTITVDFSLLPVRNAAGEVVFLLAEGRNITAKKQAEAEVARKNAELQRLLDRITQLDQRKSDLFANVSHELRTPLTLILGPVEELLEPGQLGDRQRQQLRLVQRSAQTLLKHVDDLLDLARLDSAQPALALADVDLAAVVQASAEAFEAIAPGRSVAYHLAVPPTLPARADAEKIERVVMNLLSNAFKFTPPGGRVACRLQPLGHDRALLTVQDSGPGIAPGQEAAIFDRFWQAQQGTTRPHGGTGLGLSIAREFVQLHGGSISASRAPGGGALFQVVLPLGTPGAVVPGCPPQASALVTRVLAELHSDAEPAPAQTAAAPDDRPLVLLVEDNPGMRRFVHEALAADHRVHAVADGTVALAWLATRVPDLVITDLMLPGLGGDRVVAEMRRRPALAHTPVLVLSARGDAALRAQLLAESVQDYLTKPFSPHELRARTRNLVAMAQARTQLQQALASQGQDLAQLTRTLVAQRQALQASEQRWWAIHAHSPVGIVLVDEAGTLHSANRAFCRLVGASDAGTVDGSSLERLTLADDRAPLRERLARLLAGPPCEDRLQCRFQRLDGRVAWANVALALMPASGTAQATLVLTTEDITEQKAAEESLAAARHELARVARVSTMGELAASIAHEVNQPLAAVVANGHAGLRWLDARPPDQTEARLALQRIVRDANRAGAVITRIRHFLRRGEPLQAPLDLPAVVDEVLALLRAEALQQGVRLRRRRSPPLPPARGDAVQLQQVVLNLVVNAFEAIARTGRGGGRVLIQVHAQGQCGGAGLLQVDVRDNGCGLGDGPAERLFEAFHSSKPGGLGMGLAICRSIVEAHGGRLWATPNDRPAGGASLHFTLPMA